jgi:ubiquinone/menaquinone biosynthesis C-methylase UbiE
MSYFLVVYNNFQLYTTGAIIRQRHSFDIKANIGKPYGFLKNQVGFHKFYSIFTLGETGTMKVSMQHQGVMKVSRSFDRAADFYDQTRPLFDTTLEAGMQSLLEAAGEGARILEVGAGTGRISIPLLERGADLIGCDLSRKMLSRQREKYPPARLVQSDAAILPFLSNHFEAVLVVHVMHLIGPWKESLREFKRALKPGGVFLNVNTYEPVGKSIRREIRVHWREWLKSQGFDTGHLGAQSDEEFQAEMRSLGAHTKEVEAVRFPNVFTLRIELDRYEARVFSDTWSVPEALYQASLANLRNWVVQEYADLDQEIEETYRFVFDAAYFDA